MSECDNRPSNQSTMDVPRCVAGTRERIAEQPQECVHERFVEQSVNILRPWIPRSLKNDRYHGGGAHRPTGASGADRGSCWDIPVRQRMGDIMEVEHIMSHERVHERAMKAGDAT